MNNMKTPVHIQVCLLTYKRAELLSETLHSLRRQQLGPLDVIMHILVVDNDAEGSGYETFRMAMEGSPVLARYVCEAGRGIANARNRALVESADMDYIAFIDDDETATPEWLHHLYGTLVAFKADIVTGPVSPKFVQAPQWIQRGGFFQMQPLETGSDVDFVATNNVLFRGDLTKTYQFDERFDATGGEDTHLFMRMKRDGLRFVWAQEAEVFETIPASRTNLKWMLQRAQSEANRFTRCCLDLDHSFATRSKRLLRALAGMGVGIAMLPGGIIKRRYAVRGLQYIYRAVGTMAALLGSQTIYYEPAPSLAVQIPPGRES